MTITSFVGDIGSGKSFGMVRYGLLQCEMKRKRLVANFRFNKKELIAYARYCRLPWVAHIAQTDRVIWISSINSLTDLLKYPESVVLLDEAGIFLNSREFAKTPKEFLFNLAQSRKDGIDLVWASQFDEQVDRQFRLLCQYFIHCDGGSVWDSKLRRSKMVWKCYHKFKSADFWRWQNSTARRSFFKTFFGYSIDTEIGFLSKADKQLFKAFNSFDRLDTTQAMLETFPTQLFENPRRSLFYTRKAAAWRRFPWWRAWWYRLRIRNSLSRM